MPALIKPSFKNTKMGGGFAFSIGAFFGHENSRRYVGVSLFGYIAGEDMALETGFNYMAGWTNREFHIGGQKGTYTYIEKYVNVLRGKATNLGGWQTGGAAIPFYKPGGGNVWGAGYSLTSRRFSGTETDSLSNNTGTIRLISGGSDFRYNFLEVENDHIALKYYNNGTTKHSDFGYTQTMSSTYRTFNKTSYRKIGIFNRITTPEPDKNNKTKDTKGRINPEGVYGIKGNPNSFAGILGVSGGIGGYNGTTGTGYSIDGEAGLQNDKVLGEKPQNGFHEKNLFGLGSLIGLNIGIATPNFPWEKAPNYGKTKSFINLNAKATLTPVN